MLQVCFELLLKDAKTLGLLSPGRPQPRRCILAPRHQHRAVLLCFLIYQDVVRDGAYREAHAVDALLMVGHRLQQLSLLPPGAPPRPHLSTGLHLHSCTTT